MDVQGGFAGPDGVVIKGPRAMQTPATMCRMFKWQRGTRSGDPDANDKLRNSAMLSAGKYAVEFGDRRAFAMSASRILFRGRLPVFVLGSGPVGIQRVLVESSPAVPGRRAAPSVAGPRRLAGPVRRVVWR